PYVSSRSPYPGLFSPQRLAPWHFLNFFPEPQGHGSFRPTVDQSTLAGICAPRDFVRPAPTMTGSFRATGFVAAGDSPGPMSTAPSAPFPDGTVTSSSGTSSRMPNALYRFVAFCGGGGDGAGGSRMSCTLRNRSLNVL